MWTFSVCTGGRVEMSNDALVVPSGTVTDAGTVAMVSSLDNDPVTPPDPAARPSVTRPLAGSRAITSGGTSSAMSRDGGAGRSVSPIGRVTLSSDATIVISVVD